MRGSQIQAFRNGMNVVSSFWSPLSEDMSTVERIEFVKGPAGFMMSSGDPAGIYNVVTKKPTAENKGEVDYFDNRRSNILMQRRTISGVAGFRQAPFQNFGVVTNKGIEGGMNRRTIHVRHSKTRASSNFTFARNKIIEMDEIPQLHPWMNTTGTRINALNGMWISDGLYRENDFNVTLGTDGKKQYTLKDGIPTATTMPSPLPGDLKFKDLNGDGIVNEFDRSQDVANPIVPEIIYGFGLNLQYKGIYAVCFSRALIMFRPILIKGKFFFSFRGLTESKCQTGNTGKAAGLNKILRIMSSFPCPCLRTWEIQITATTLWVRDASLKIEKCRDRLYIAKSLIERLKFRNTRLYIMGQNLYVWYKVKMYDPELGNSAAGIPNTADYARGYTGLNLPWPQMSDEIDKTSDGTDDNTFLYNAGSTTLGRWSLYQQIRHATFSEIKGDPE
ncbi:hypothetical protein FQR65_LT15214 [Abscondita terminalis]|nr:hypothetical protein FQR65_LT15214 [Abscondita terminalis]